MSDATKTISAQLREVERALLPLARYTGCPKKLEQVFNGFLVELECRWYWITAGHVIKSIEDHIESSKFQFLSIVTNRTDPRTAVDAVCFDAEISSFPRMDRRAVFLMEWERDDPNDLALQDVDLGFLILPAALRQELLAVGVKPFQHRQANMKMPSNFDEAKLQTGEYALRLSGVPKNMFSISAEQVLFSPKHLPLLPDKREADTYRPPNIRFQPDWHESEHGRVGGMSGGPILFLGLEEPFLLAVQSKESRDDNPIPNYVVGIQSAALLLEIIERWSPQLSLS